MDALASTITAAKRRILSVGSGDGSQQAAIVQSGHHNIISTFFDSEKVVNTKYEASREHVKLLRAKSTVLFGVDATMLHEHADLKDKKFDIIVFTFPHTGVPNSSANSIDSNKQLIRDFLKSAQRLITSNGEISITLKTSAPYDKWAFPHFEQYEIESKSKHDFDSPLFPGYNHRSTNGHVNIVNNGRAKTYVFGRKENHEDDKDGDASSLSSITLSIGYYPVDDGDIEAYAIEILLVSKDKSCNVLDIRREFPEAIRPDTRQLNRILYRLESMNRLKKGPSKRTSQKPTWKLVDT